MTLKEAIRIGKVCGLETVDEAVLNVELSAMQIFPYEDIPKELRELNSEYDEYKEKRKNKKSINI